jgi:hypothetical protein
MVAEHHLHGQRLQALVDETAPRLGWRAHCAEARSTGKGGTSGGVGVFARRHLQVAYPGPIEQSRGQDWARVGLRLKGVTILLGAVYLQVGGATGVLEEANLERLFQLRPYLDRCALPFVLAGDWNCTPTDLKTLSWLDDLQADVVLPWDLGFTCTSGEGRVLDYWVASRSLIPPVQAAARDPEASWRPHVGIEIRLSKRVRACHACHLVTITPWPEEAKHTPWRQALATAQNRLAGRPVVLTPCAHEPSALIRRVLDSWAEGLTERYAVWCQAAEVSVGITKPGRGQPPRVRWKAVVPRKPALDWASCPRERHWQRVAGYAGELRRGLQVPPAIAITGGTQLHTQRVVGKSRSLLRSHFEDPVLAQAWEALARPAQDLEQGFLAQVSEHVEHELNQVRGNAKQAARQAFREWAIRAVQQGAGKARFWTKKSGVRPRLADVLVKDGLNLTTDPADLMTERRKFWQGFWHMHCEPQGLLLALGSLRRRAMHETKRMPELSLERLARVLQTLPAKPTLWADGWRQAELQELPAEALHQLLGILRDVEISGAGRSRDVAAQARPDGRAADLRLRLLGPALGAAS